MVFRKILLFFVTLSMIGMPLSGHTQSNPLLVIEKLVSQRKENELQKFRKKYGSLDYTDNQGQTALCRAVYRKDYIGYHILAKNGANRGHPCIQQLSMSQKLSFDRGYKSFIRNLQNQYAGAKSYEPLWWGIGGALGVGGIVALAAGGGGGSDSSSKNNENQNNGNQNNDFDKLNPETEPIPAGNFETSEYFKGSFLSQIGASNAYGRFYIEKQNEDGTTSLTHNLKTVKVGVIDTGIDATHTDLKNIVTTGYNFDYGPCTTTVTRNCWAFKDADWVKKHYNEAVSAFVLIDGNGKAQQAIQGSSSEFNEWASTYDPNYSWSNNKNNTTPNLKAEAGYHGTLVSGIIGAEKNDSGMHGVAPNTQIIPIRYDMMTGQSEPIKTLIDNGAKVINMSLGVPSSTKYNASLAKQAKTSYENYMHYNLSGYKALADAKSTVLVVAAGNEGNSQPTMEAGAGLYYPELQKLMLVVVSVDKNNKLSWFSNKCGATSDYCIAAPGENITSTSINGKNQTESGTSTAAPIVSGAVAFLMGAYPNLTATSVTSLILETATDLGNPNETGHGLLNLDAATKPVGKLSLATTNSVNGNKLNFNGTNLRIPQVMQMMSQQIPLQVAVLDKYDRTFNVPTANIVQVMERDGSIFQNKLHRFMKFDSIKHIAQDDSPLSFKFSTASKKDSQTGIGAMDITYHFGKNDVRFYFQEDTTFGNVDYFDRTTLNPFSAMDNAYGIDNTYHLTQKTNLNFGFVSGKNALFKTTDEDDDSIGRMTAFQGGMSYQANDKLAFNVIGGILSEENSLLGLHGNGGFDVDKTQTYYVGVTAKLSPTERWRLSGSYYYGMTPSQQLNSFMKTNRLYSESIAFDARYLMDKENYVGFILSSPLRIRQGHADFTLPTGRDYYSDTMYHNKTKLKLKPDAREWDTGIYGVYAITPDLRIKSQGMIRFNPEHQSHVQPDYQVLFGLNWNWN